MTTLVYDGSFEGLMTAVFEVYEYKYQDAEIISEIHFQPDFFSEKHQVITSPEKADRVLKKLDLQIGSSGIKTLLNTYFSEDPNLENVIFHVVKYAVSKPTEDVMKDFAHPAVLQALQISKIG